MRPKGGRGNTAPYESHVVKVPKPILNQVKELLDRYHLHLQEGGDTSNPPILLDKCTEQAFNQAIDSISSSDPESQRKKLLLELNYLKTEKKELELKTQKLEKELSEAKKEFEELSSDTDLILERTEKSVNSLNQDMKELKGWVKKLKVSQNELIRRLKVNQT